MDAVSPIYTAELFSPLHRELIALLRGLDEDDWERRTIAGSWRVRDVAAHLFDNDLRRLAADRDGHRAVPRAPITSFTDVVALVNRMNAEGVGYAQRLSARVITDLLDITGAWVSTFVEGLPPHERAPIPVAWAGEEQSENWMDTGREYTERWHHQMQIRDAVGAPGLLERRWVHPVLDLSVRAFPRAFGSVTADDGTAVVFEVSGDGGGEWSVVREQDQWRLGRGAVAEPAARVWTDADTAWRLLFNALPAAAIAERVHMAGDRSLTAPMLGARAVMVESRP